MGRAHVVAWTARTPAVNRGCESPVPRRRTVAQDVWANIVEERGRELGVGLKFGAGSVELQAQFIAMADVLARFDRGELTQEELREALKTVR
jgi:hypothetical protein